MSSAKRSCLISVVSLAATCCLGAIAASPNKAYAYNFPFQNCQQYYTYYLDTVPFNRSKRIVAQWDHNDGKKQWFFITRWDGEPMRPNEYLHPDNWAHCYLGEVRT